jgi:hypothetical protein
VLCFAASNAQQMDSRAPSLSHDALAVSCAVASNALRPRRVLAPRSSFPCQTRLFDVRALVPHNGPPAYCAADHEQREQEQHGYDLRAALPPPVAEDFVGSAPTIVCVVGRVTPPPRNGV